MVKKKQFSQLPSDELISFISHELKDPLNGLLGMSELLLETPLNDKQKIYLESIYYSAQNLHRTIKKISDLTHLEFGKLDLYVEDVDFLEILNKVINDLFYGISKKKIELEQKTQAQTTSIQTDTERLKTLVSAILNHFIRFNYDSKISLYLEEVEESLELTIRDLGTNCAKRKKLFDSIIREQKIDHLDPALLEVIYLVRLAHYLGGEISYLGEEDHFSEIKLKILKKN